MGLPPLPERNEHGEQTAALLRQQVGPGLSALAFRLVLEHALLQQGTQTRRQDVLGNAQARLEFTKA